MFKKLNKGLALLGVVGALALGTAFAQNETSTQPGQMGPGYGPGPMHQGAMGPGYGPGPKHYGPRGSFCGSNVDPQKAQAFCKEIQPLWEKMWQIKRELRELWSKNPPDWSAIEKKEMELEKIKLEIRKKAYEEGIFCGYGRGLRLKGLCGW
jgi:Spy/CpxP family protein refolding chaperone